MPQTLAVILLATIAIPAAVAGFAESLRSRSATATAAVDFFNPVAGGGSWLDNAGGGLGEPLNVSHPIITDSSLCVEYSTRRL